MFKNDRKRPHVPGREYHLIINAPDGSQLCRDDQDKFVLKKILAREREKSDVVLKSGAILNTHAHMQTIDGVDDSISRYMQRSLTGYADYLKARYGQRGHILRSRYTRIFLGRRLHKLVLIPYNILNPQRAGIVRTVRDLETHPFTAYPELLGNAEESWMSVPETLALFGDSSDEARLVLRRWVESRASGRWLDEIDELLRRIPATGMQLSAAEKERRLGSLAADVAAAASTDVDTVLKRGNLDATAALVFLAVHRLGYSRTEIARSLEVDPRRGAELYRKGDAVAKEMGFVDRLVIDPAVEDDASEEDILAEFRNWRKTGS